jgi:hypothetical protein
MHLLSDDLYGRCIVLVSRSSRPDKTAQSDITPSKLFAALFDGLSHPTPVFLPDRPRHVTRAICVQPACNQPDFRVRNGYEKGARKVRGRFVFRNVRANSAACCLRAFSAN